MKKIRNIVVLSLFVTFMYSCDADVMIDEPQADVIDVELVDTKTGNEGNPDDERD